MQEMDRNAFFVKERTAHAAKHNRSSSFPKVFLPKSFVPKVEKIPSKLERVTNIYMMEILFGDIPVEIYCNWFKNTVMVWWVSVIMATERTRNSILELHKVSFKIVKFS